MPSPGNISVVGYVNGWTDSQASSQESGSWGGTGQCTGLTSPMGKIGHQGPRY